MWNITDRQNQPVTIERLIATYPELVMYDGTGTEVCAFDLEEGYSPTDISSQRIFIWSSKNNGRAIGCAIYWRA